MNLLVYFIQTISALYIVQTNDYNLHFIKENEPIETVKIFSLETQMPTIRDVMEETTTDKIVTSKKNYVDNIFIRSDGIIFFENKRFSVDSLINKPRIINNIIFQTEKKCITSKLFDVVVFIVRLDLLIIDIETFYTRTHSISYVYCPFSSDKNMVADKHNLLIDGRTYFFESDIVAVYSTREYNGTCYMNRIYSNTSIVTYVPQVSPRTPLHKYLFTFVLVSLSLTLFIYYKSRGVKISKLIMKTNDYELYEGVNKNDKVLIKKYKKHFKHLVNEIDLLKACQHQGISRMIGFENGILSMCLIFEYSDPLQRLSIQQMKQLVDIVIHISSMGVKQIDLNPLKFRLQNGYLQLFDIGYTNGEFDIWNCHNIPENDITFSLGILVHYFLTGLHPFDIETDESITSKVKDDEFGADKSLRQEGDSCNITNKIFEKCQLSVDQMQRRDDKRFFNNISKEIYEKSSQMSRNAEIYSENQHSHATKIENTKNSEANIKIKKFVNCKTNQNTSSSVNNGIQKDHTVDDFFEITKQYAEDNCNHILDSISINRYSIRTKDPLCHDIIYHAIKRKRDERIDLNRFSKHPFFWSKDRIFSFLASYSDLLEASSMHVKRLERNKKRIFVKPWNTYVDQIIEDELSVFRIYNYNSAKDLIRVIRNKGRHYNQIPQAVKDIYGNFEGFIDYWLTRFPGLLIVCYNCGENFKEDELLAPYY